jgi:hypothetical protein
VRPLAGQPAAPALLGRLRLVAASYACGVSFHSSSYRIDSFYEPFCYRPWQSNRHTDPNLQFQARVHSRNRANSRQPRRVAQGTDTTEDSTGVSLISLCLGFSIVGMLIIVNRYQADLNGLSGESSVATAGGIGAILVGMAFLVAACLHWNFWTGCSGPRDAEESVPDT